MSTFINAVNHPYTILKQKETIEKKDAIIRNLEDRIKELERESAANVKIIRGLNWETSKRNIAIFGFAALSLLVIYQMGPINLWNYAWDAFNRSLLKYAPVNLEDPETNTHTEIPTSLGSLGSPGSPGSQYELPSILKYALGVGKNPNEDETSVVPQ